MGKTKKTNQGFSLIELLIAITILSIIMIMVSQFMSTTSGAYRKSKKNMSIQTEAMQVIEQMSDTLMQADYVRIESMDGKMYTITKNATGKNERVVTEDTSKGTVDYSFVPDNYGNYSKMGGYYAEDRKVIVDYDNFQIVSETGDAYPISGDAEEGQKVRSFRALKTGADYSYIMPSYIYAEYSKTRDDGTEATVHVIFYFTPANAKTGTRSVFMHRYETTDPVNKRSLLYATAKLQVYTNAAVSADGLLTEHVVDFYLSADSEGNALLTNILFEEGGYQYNAVETINFRNSNVLTVRPQKLYKVKGTGVTTP
ncbi:MAG: prepilin-type N-terminal cleavage/methylation domain-containing protein [Lachnospiraceae bacterium]|nr:prepilin-type N-terminal cleavage/methylation domain-containing protein [Lachnospiraceae bacterium]